MHIHFLTGIKINYFDTHITIYFFNLKFVNIYQQINCSRFYSPIVIIWIYFKLYIFPELPRATQNGASISILKCMRNMKCQFCL